jgi:hypothetical protein
MLTRWRITYDAPLAHPVDRVVELRAPSEAIALDLAVRRRPTWAIVRVERRG